MHVRGDVHGALAAHNAGDQLGDRRDGQPGERQHRSPGSQGSQRRAWRGDDVAVAAHHGRGARRQPPGQEVKQQLRGLVGPLQVIEQHQQRLDPRLGQQQRGHLVKQLKAGGGRRVIDGGRPVAGGQWRVQAERPHDLDPRPVPRRPLARPAPAPRDAEAAALSVAGRLGEHRGLADARLPGQQQQLAAPGQGRVGHTPQAGEHVAAADRAHLAGTCLPRRPRPAAGWLAGTHGRHPTTVTPADLAPGRLSGPGQPVNALMSKTSKEASRMLSSGGWNWLVTWMNVALKATTKPPSVPGARCIEAEATAHPPVIWSRWSRPGPGPGGDPRRVLAVLTALEIFGLACSLTVHRSYPAIMNVTI